MILRDSRLLWGRLVLALVSFVVLCGFLASLTWSGGSLASERDSASSAETCQTPDELSSRGAEILCEVAESDRETMRSWADGATPVPGRDALDRDPLDGPVRKKPLPDPDNATQLTIVQSGRQKDTPNSTPLYDGDPDTTWSPANDAEPWVWVDVGDTETLRNVRWLASGSGEVEISVSSDRKRWAVLDTQNITGAWQEVTLREDAQYVRLTLMPDENVSDVELAEVEVFGRERKADVSTAQEADNGNRKRDKRGSSATRADDVPVADDASRDNQRNSSNASAKAGKTKCSGKRERCRATPGKVEVTDECDGNGTCTIDIRADGGSAVCDASGGDEDRAGDGEGKRGGGNGGRCEAVANGGAVTIGDVNP